MQEIHIPEHPRQIPHTEARKRTDPLFALMAENEYIIAELAKDAARETVISVMEDLSTEHLFVPGMRDYCRRKKGEYIEELHWDNFDAFVPYVQSCAFLSSRQYTNVLSFFDRIRARLKQEKPDEFAKAAAGMFKGLDKDDTRHVAMYMQIRFEEKYMDQESGMVRSIVREYIPENLNREIILEAVRGNPNYAEEFAAKE